MLEDYHRKQTTERDKKTGNIFVPTTKNGAKHVNVVEQSATKAARNNLPNEPKTEGKSQRKHTEYHADLHDHEQAKSHLDPFSEIRCAVCARYPTPVAPLNTTRHKMTTFAHPSSTTAT